MRQKIYVPGDKSITHRAIMLASLAQGISHIKGFSNGNDCLFTIKAMQNLGAKIEIVEDKLCTIHGVGISGLKNPFSPIICGNSGTTLRLLAGILAGQHFPSELDGFMQLKTRPMNRIIIPLNKMGAKLSAHDGCAPINIQPSPALLGIRHVLNIPSAQVKSCLLLAGLYAQGPTKIVDRAPTRDHTERMLAAMGASVTRVGKEITVNPLSKELLPIRLTVPGDISSAAFLMVAATITDRMCLEIPAVGVNPTRTGIIDALKTMGANIQLQNLRDECGEPVADIFVEAASLHGATFGGDIIVRMIDELPILAVAATQANGKTIVKNAEELRVKETDRIKTIVGELKKLGAHIEATVDGFVIEGPTKLIGTKVNSHGDHRIAMALTIAGLCATEKTEVENSEVSADSFPGFRDLILRNTNK